MERRDALYGRRKGKKLSPRRTGLMATLYPTLAVDLSAPAPSDLRALFPVPVDAVRLEIGFGGGEHMLAEATRSPDIGFIGVEPFVNGMAKAVSAIAETGARNIRLHDGDAALLLDWLPPASLVGVDLLYPDPWPKKRHFKRRFVSDENLDRVARALKPGGLFRVASDIESYIDWTLLHVLKRSDLAWTAERADDWRKPFPGWPGTRYEAKAVAAGRMPAYLAFLRR
jgi:tRNA (guanine-N7-)-methyltransferase